VSERRSAWAGIAAFVSVVAASSCCLPVLPFVAAAGLAGGSTFLLAARPYLLAFSILALAYGFFQARQAKKCGRRRRVMGPVVLWLATIMVAASILFPQALANLAAGVPAK